MSSTQVTDHLGRVQADAITTDALVVGSQGTDIGKAWTQTTTTLTGGVLGTGGGNIVRYQIIGKTCICHMSVSHNVAGTASGTLNLSLPVPARTITSIAGAGLLVTTTNAYQITAVADAASRIALYATINTSGPEVISNASTAGTRLTQDLWNLTLQLTYETM